MGAIVWCRRELQHKSALPAAEAALATELASETAAALPCVPSQCLANHRLTWLPHLAPPAEARDAT
eukprot:12426803-Karenia_brevis.AAC.1